MDSALCQEHSHFVRIYLPEGCMRIVFVLCWDFYAAQVANEGQQDRCVGDFHTIMTIWATNYIFGMRLNKIRIIFVCFSCPGNFPSQ